MGFITIVDVKLGNMRKAKDWTVTPMAEMAQGIVTMQSDNRITRIDLNTGKAMLSNGKGGHQGFIQLLPALGAVEITVPEDVLKQVREKTQYRTDHHGPANVHKLAFG